MKLSSSSQILSQSSLSFCSHCPFKSIALQEGHSGRNKQHKRTKERQSSIMPPLTSFPPLLFSFPSSPATFICCPINNCYCSFNYAPVISKSGGHVSSPSQGSLGNYQHPSKGRCSCSSVAAAIITLPSLTSVPWARSPSGLSLSHHASLCQALTSDPTHGSTGLICLLRDRKGQIGIPAECKSSEV